MSMDLSALENDHENCRLIDRRLVQWHDRLAEALRDVRASLSEYLDESIWPAIEKPYASGRRFVKLNHYRVGFIGRSQVGKSSTFNNLLGIVKVLLSNEEYERQAPATSGAQRATTANVTRLHRADNNFCRVRYLTPEQHQTRCKKLFQEVLGAPAESNWSVDEALQQLQNLSTSAKVRNDDAAFLAAKATQLDRDKLKQYLISYKTFAAQYVNVAQPPRVDDPNYADRRQYINHPPAAQFSAIEQQSGRFQALARWVELGFKTDAVAPELELIDLPGLGASLWDDNITSELVQDGLDAAFVFISAVENIEPTDLRRALESLHAYFGGVMKDRVWVVVTKIDGLTDAALAPETGQTFFKNLGEVIVNSNNIPEDQVIFVVNKLFETFAKQGDDGKIVCQIGNDAIQAAFGTMLDSEGKLVVPEKWGELPPLWRSQLQNLPNRCGLDLLHKIISKDVATGVRRRVNHDIVDMLDARTRESLIRTLRIRKRGLNSNDSAPHHAKTWRSELRELRKYLHQTSLFADQTKNLQDALSTRFEQLCKPGSHYAHAELPEEHDTWCEGLYDLALKKVSNELIPHVYGELLNRLRESGNNNKIEDVPIAIVDSAATGNALELKLEDPTLLKAFDYYAAVDGTQLDGIKSVLDQVLGKELFGPDRKRRPFDDTNAYREYTAAWLPVWTRRTVNAIANRVQARLLDLENQLQILAKCKSSPDPSRTEKLFESGIARLEAIGPAPNVD